jgi:hypothetical protein
MVDGVRTIMGWESFDMLGKHLLFVCFLDDFFLLLVP